MARATEDRQRLEPALELSEGKRVAPPALVGKAFRSIGAPISMFVGVVGLWEVISRIGLVNPFIAPAPSAIAVAFRDLISEGFFWTSARTTLLETLVGFALGVIGGFLIGVLATLFLFFRQSFYPYVIGFQNMPRVALAPLFVTWFGFGLTSKIIMAATIAFFPLVVNTVAGLQSVDRDAQLMMRSVGATRWQMFRYLTLPSAAPLIFAAVKTAVTLALIGAIVGEFVGASEGLGVLLETYQFQLNTPRVFVVIIFLALMGLALYGMIAWAERKIIFWRPNISPGNANQ